MTILYLCIVLNTLPLCVGMHYFHCITLKLENHQNNIVKLYCNFIIIPRWLNVLLSIHIIAIMIRWTDKKSIHSFPYINHFPFSPSIAIDTKSLSSRDIPSKILRFVKRSSRHISRLNAMKIHIWIVVWF